MYGLTLIVLGGLTKTEEARGQSAVKLVSRPSIVRRIRKSCKAKGQIHIITCKYLNKCYWLRSVLTD